MFDISIIVATYNSEISKLFKTLNSIIMQENIKFEIVIADDGSYNFDDKIIKNFLLNKNFNNFKLLHHEKNVGTVNNIYEALKLVTAKYIKLISPGDFLYSKDTLHNWLEYMKTKKSKICFSKIIPYYINDKNECKINYSFFKPDNDFVYKHRFSKESILINMCLISNTPVGAAYIVSKDLYVKYFNMIKDKICYTEDYAYKLMVLDDIKIDYYQNNGVWYEVGTGISTSHNKKWEDKLKKDENELYKIMNQNKYKGISKKFIKLLTYKDKNNYKLKKILFFPEYIFWVLIIKFNLKNYSEPIDEQFYNEINMI